MQGLRDGVFPGLKGYVDCSSRVEAPVHLRGDGARSFVIGAIDGASDADGYFSVDQHSGDFGDLAVRGVECAGD